MTDHSTKPSYSFDRPPEHRRSGRLRCEMLRCNIGTVVDMSATGMRVRIKRSSPPKWTTRTVKLRSLDGKDRIRVRKVWIRQIDERCFELGLHFENVTMEGRERLKDIARLAGVRFRLDSHSGAKRCA